MERLKIAITQLGNDAASDDFVRLIFEDTAMGELCTPFVYDDEQAALRDLGEGKVDALVLAPSIEPLKRPAGAVEIIATEETNFMPLREEPTAEDIVRLHDILERDFDRRSPRIAIVQEGETKNPELASQVTDEQGINTYGPYTLERLKTEEGASHFDGIIVVGDTATEQRTIAELSQEAPVRFFAGTASVITALYRPLRKEETEDGLADVSASTHPFYAAIDIVRNRATYDEARQNPLPKLFRDKREDRERGEKPKVEKLKAENDGQ
ncbi:MAG: hypothetical protein II675_05725 [Bacteroidaceae bacterium]|nr:hypothetical protein [Bacteroidaceae bacterium]